MPVRRRICSGTKGHLRGRGRVQGIRPPVRLQVRFSFDGDFRYCSIDVFSRCHNLPGSYRCVCPFGYELAPDGRHCRDVDECSAPNGHACRYECKNLIGSHACVCPEGYRKVMGADDQCQDVDECSQGEELCGKGLLVPVPTPQLPIRDVSLRSMCQHPWRLPLRLSSWL